MFPVFWCWAPQFKFPWSGSVMQDIDPDVSWFFNSIKPTAGHARIEQRAFEIASYGKQIGLITEVLIELAEQNPMMNSGACPALNSLRRIHDEITKIRYEIHGEELVQAELHLSSLQEKLEHHRRAIASK